MYIRIPFVLRPIQQHYVLERYLLRASLYRKQFVPRFAASRKLAEVTGNSSTAFQLFVMPAVASSRSRNLAAPGSE